MTPLPQAEKLIPGTLTGVRFRKRFMNKKSILIKKLEKIQAIFDTEKFTSREAVSIQNIAHYYAINRVPYFLFHNTDGFVHMGMSIGAQFKEEDFLEQAKIVSSYLKEDDKVLELALGKGSNSAYLAKKLPRTSFFGIDLDGGQLAPAVKQAKKLSNFFPESGDYHDLSRYADNQFDCVFVIEALCHSVNKIKVIKEVQRVLKNGGYFIIIDGYAARSESELSSDELLAKHLTERGMMVADFEEYSKVREKLISSGFKLIMEENATEKILPTLKRLEERKLTRWFFASPNLGKLITKVLPMAFTGNAVSAYLMRILCENQDVFCYWVTVAKKE